MRAFFALPLLTIAPLALVSPLAAQTAAPVVKTTEAQPTPPPSADRVAAAKPVIDKLWPLGTYRKMMNEQMSDMVYDTMASMMDMKGEDMLPGRDIPASAKGKTIADINEALDPHFRERMRIMMDVMFKEMAPVADKIEPSVRSALTAEYAREYTVAQLRELDHFFATPTGQLYAQKWVASFYSPEMASAMKDYMPEFMEAMPGIMEKVEKATAHLPLPNKMEPVTTSEVAAEAEESNPAAKWSAADQKLDEKLRRESLGLNQRAQTAYARQQLHALEAEERSGRKLDEYEIYQRDELRAQLKGKK